MAYCKQCSTPLKRSGGGALFCFPCSQLRARIRIGDASRKRHAQLHPMSLAGEWVCRDCKCFIGQCVQGGKKRRPSLRCDSCRWVHRIFLDILSGRQEAARAIAAERRHGRLSAPSDFVCTDCPRPAECYDHRDYGQPLRVDPVCRSCNVLRGHAKPVNPWIVSGLLTQLIGTEGAPAVAEPEAKAA